MSVFNSFFNSSCTYVNHLFGKPICEGDSLESRIENIVFYTLFAAVSFCCLISCCRSKVASYRHLNRANREKSPVDQSLSAIRPIEVEALLYYNQEKFQYTENFRQPSVDLFDLQKIITLQRGTLKIEVDMKDEGMVEQVSNNPVFLYTDYIGPCIAAIGRCRVLHSSKLIGVTHLFPEDEDYGSDLSTQVSLVLAQRGNLKDLNKEENVKNKQFKSNKFYDLINKFLSHPSYKGEEIELFFAGGNGDPYDEFWRELVVESARSVPKVRVIGTYFNPYQATPEIQKKINLKKLGLSFLAGITNDGSILIHKSHNIDFQSPNARLLLEKA